MRRILTALLCSSLLIGGTAPAHASDTSSNAILGGLVVGQTDWTAYLEHLSKCGCEASEGWLMGESSAVVPSECFDLPGSEVHFFPHELDSGRTVVKSAYVTYLLDPAVFETYAEALRKKYGEPENAARSGGKRDLVWIRDGIKIRLFYPSMGFFGFLAFSSPELEARTEEQRREREREVKRRIESML